VKVGVGELDQDKLSPLLKLKYNDPIAGVVADLGRPEEIGHIFTGFPNTSTSSCRTTVLLFHDLGSLANGKQSA